jgi:hypothetical protein
MFEPRSPSRAGAPPLNPGRACPSYPNRRYCALEPRKNTMANGSSLSLDELEDRMAIVRDNIRQLIEQAAGYSGAEDEERNADRIAEQQAELEKLTKQRDALLKKKR